MTIGPAVQEALSAKGSSAAPTWRFFIRMAGSDDLGDLRVAEAVAIRSPFLLSLDFGLERRTKRFSLHFAPTTPPDPRIRGARGGTSSSQCGIQGQARSERSRHFEAHEAVIR